jgi:hypothetical protein
LTTEQLRGQGILESAASYIVFHNDDRHGELCDPATCNNVQVPCAKLLLHLFDWPRNNSKERKDTNK